MSQTGISFLFALRCVEPPLVSKVNVNLGSVTAFQKTES